MIHVGSCLHALRALKYPRWEDYDYELLDEAACSNRMFWLGDGMTWNEKTMTGDRTHSIPFIRIATLNIC